MNPKKAYAVYARDIRPSRLHEYKEYNAASKRAQKVLRRSEEVYQFIKYLDECYERKHGLKPNSVSRLNGRITLIRPTSSIMV